MWSPRSSFLVAAALVAVALSNQPAAAQDPAREVEPRAEPDDLESASLVLVERSSSREARREAAAALLFRHGAAGGIARINLELQKISTESALAGTVEGQILQALYEALEAPPGSGADFDPGLIHLAPSFLRLTARKDDYDAARRALRALLQSNLRATMIDALREVLRKAGAPELRRDALIAVARLRLVETCSEVAAIAFEAGENALLRRTAQTSLGELALHGFEDAESFEIWHATWTVPSDAAWAAGERLRSELHIARRKLVEHAAGDLDLLLDLLADPTFPDIRWGAARGLAATVTRFVPERDAEPLRRVMSELDARVRNELFPDVLAEMATCLRNLAPLVGLADRCVALAAGDEAKKERCEQFRLHIKPLRDLLIALVPPDPAPEAGLWIARARAVEALRWYPLDPLVHDLVVDLLERILAELRIADRADREAYETFRRSVLGTAAELELAGVPATKALALIEKLASEAEVELRRFAVPLLRALGENAEIGPAALGLLERLASREGDPGIRCEALDAFAEVAARHEEARPRAFELFATALEAASLAVRAKAAAWLARSRSDARWSETFAGALGPLLVARLRPGGETDPLVRSDLARVAVEALRPDWLAIALEHLADDELPPAARWMRLALDGAPDVGELARLELAEHLGTRLPETAFAMLWPERRMEGEVLPVGFAERRERVLLRLAWEAFARLERFQCAPRMLSELDRDRLEALLRRIERWPSGEDDFLQRVDLELRVHASERVARELTQHLEAADIDLRCVLLDRLIWANWRVERWTEAAQLAGQRVEYRGSSPSWWVGAMAFEARLARERDDGTMPSAEILRQARSLIAAPGATVTPMLVVRRTLDVVHLFERQELKAEAQKLLEELASVEELPRQLARELAAARASYR